MIEQITYLALLSAPEIASGASSLAGTMVEAVGRRFASGVYDAVSEKISRDTSSIGNALLGAIGGRINGLAEGLQESAAQALSAALQGEGAALASAEELRLLRKLAADASAGTEVEPVLVELRRFYAQHAARTKE